MMKNHIASSLLGTLMVLPVTAAVAALDPVAVHAKSTVSNLQFTLTDLKPNDWVQPSLKSQGSSVMLDASGFGMPQSSALTASPFDTSSSSLSGSTQYVPTGTAVASKIARGLSTEINLSRDTAFTYGSYPYLTQPYATTGASVTAASKGTWLLSAGTQLVISGTVSLDLSIDAAATAQKAGSAWLELGARSNYAFRLLSQEGSNWKEVDSAFGELSVLQQSTGYGPLAGDVFSNGLSQAFTLTLQNPGTSSMLVSLDLSSYTTGTIARATALPEPGTWAFMGLGLGLMTWRVRAKQALISA